MPHVISALIVYVLSPGLMSAQSTWIQQLPSNVPSAWYVHAMADYATRAQVVLFGGSSDFYPAS